jgi:ABC-2 type transport system permease protein
VTAATATHTVFLFGRVMRNLARQPIWIALFVIQPLFWLLLYSQLFERVIDLPGFETKSYIDFIAPGVAVMTAFFSGTWAGMGMIEDLDRGVVERFLATPVRRSSIVLSRVLQSAATATIQAFIILLVALALGATNGAPLGWLVILLASFLVAGCFAGISNGIALLTRQEATMIALANFIGLPLLFFSSTLIASSLIPDWMRILSLGNPVEWAVRSAREVVVIGPTAWGEIALFLGLLTGFLLLTSAFATWTFRAYQRTL